jgi:hypothetical protein
MAKGQSIPTRESGESLVQVQPGEQLQPSIQSAWLFLFKQADGKFL